MKLKMYVLIKKVKTSKNTAIKCNKSCNRFKQSNKYITKYINILFKKLKNQ